MPMLIKPQELLEPLANRTISSIHLIRYVDLDGTLLFEDDMMLELAFDDGGVVYLQGAADGEHLALYAEPWEDPFAEPLSPENRQFVEECGKWTKFDVSREAPYDAFVGQTIIRLESIHNSYDTFAGVALFTSVGVIQYYNCCDEGYLACHENDLRMTRYGFTRKAVT